VKTDNSKQLLSSLKPALFAGGANRGKYNVVKQPGDPTTFSDFAAATCDEGFGLPFERNGEFPNSAPDFLFVHGGKTQLQSLPRHASSAVVA
jgi:hypothetical protein